MKKSVKWVIGILLVALIAFYSVYQSMQPIEAELAEVMSRTVASTFEEEGVVKAVNQREVYSLSSKKIVNLPVEEGQYIEKGQIIAQLDNEQMEKKVEKEVQVLEAQKKNTVQLMERELSELRSQIEQQQLSTEETNRQLLIASKDLERIQDLYKQKSVSTAEVEIIENQVKQLQSTLSKQNLTLKQLQEQYDSPESETRRYYNSSIQIINAQLEQLKSEIEDNKIVAPISGTLVDLKYKLGAVINPQEPICTIYDSKEYNIEVYVLSENTVKLKKGMKVDLTQKLTEEDIYFIGVIDYIAPAAEETMSSLGLKEKRVKVLVKIEDLKQAKISLGYSVDVRFTTFKGEGLIAIPKISTFQVEGKDAVWTVKEGEASIRYIKKGLSTDVDIVVNEGLSEGEVIIKDPNIEGLNTGKKVKSKK